ncbi:lytic polysaccharide monooxygenase [Cucurbitaria berberidis CBS 394.84]|uniref:Lytic polysaccharide monooxygenase n=1 Tax=Cucurbitaria berberidis CBS 394.84 TaxID=1168544 RepID=A0A9P4GCU3_9PLEO|nr:lytic polysaccharide monooxygenase [Cucurbitaria berberidis CBS 394.84]KAF1843181.1 lytic polysaccharide monooxygenase [Cucurbitaria berberidis CBS 394.84]
MYQELTFVFFSLFQLIAAHGRITNITTSTGSVYPGWDPEFAKQPTPAPQLAAWTSSNLGNIFVPPSRFNTTDIACHYDAVPGALHVNTTAGDTLKLQWNEWPTSHVGPVLTYLAECNGSCASVEKSSLKWVKIDELGWLNSTGWDTLKLGGTWATDVLIANHFTWTIKIPAALASGNYVVRHEIIALHVAEQLDGAQMYPQCFNIRVANEEGRGEQKLEGGVMGTKMYGMRDGGILVDVHKKIAGYEIPGPKLWSGAMKTRQPNVRKLVRRNA